MPFARAFSSRFDRIDVETMVHSDSGFLAVSYLWAKRAILKEKPESGDDLTCPQYSKNQTSFASKLSCVAITVNGSVHGVLEFVTSLVVRQAHGGWLGSCWERLPRD